MKISIDSSVIDALDGQSGRIDSLRFFKDFFVSLESGWHCFTLNKKQLNKLKNMDCFGEFDKALLRVAIQRRTFEGESFKEIPVFRTFYHSDYGGGQVGWVDLKGYAQKFIELGVLRKPMLVLENQNDDLVYSRILSEVKDNDSRYSEAQFHYAVIHGGGNTTADVCEENFTDTMTLFSICDSDKKTPLCNSGPTSARVREFFDEKGMLDNYYETTSQEVENLIPLGLLKETARDTQMGAVKFVEHVASIDPEAYFYYDMKNGYKYSEVYLEVEGRISQYWRDFYESFPDVNYSEWGQDQANDNLTNSLSSMLSHAMERINDYEGEIKPDLLAEIWKDIGTRLAYWFVGTEAIGF